MHDAIKITILIECQPLYLASIISSLKSQLLSNYEMNFVQGSQLFLTIKFKVISRFCPGKKSHSPGFGADNFDTKGRH